MRESVVSYGDVRTEWDGKQLSAKLLRAWRGVEILREMGAEHGGGKRDGDGATWAGGTPDFLDDLWTTLEKLVQETGTPYDHDPTSRQFRGKMRQATPSPNTVREQLKLAGLRPRDVKSGAVRRENYAEFVGK